MVSEIRKLSMRTYLLVFLLIFGLYTSVFAQDDFFLTISNSRSRAIAMGGAVTALEDDIGAISYNPGTFDLVADRSKMRLSAHLNPVMPLISFSETENFRGNGKVGINSILWSLHYLIKAVTFSASIFDIGILFNEEKFFKRDGGKVFNGNNFLDNVYHSAIANINLSSQVSIGVAGSFIRNTDTDGLEEGSGLSYGVLVIPSNKYQVGITYFNFSNGIHDIRRRFDRIADESLNAGIAFFPWSDVTLSIDVRNLTESSKPEKFGLQEFHLGFETTQIKHIALRGGYYREKISKGEYSHIFSAGIGLIDINYFKSPETQYNHPTPLISYTLLLENTPLSNYRWHFFTIGFRI